MAQPVNTFDSYDMRGIREDLSDVIFNIAPDETPLLTACAKVSIGNTYYEWQTDALRSAQENAHIQGDDTIAEVVAPTTRLGNYTQNFKNAVTVSGTDIALKKAGRGSEMQYQVIKKTKEHKLDIERALFLNQARVGGSSVEAPRFAGIPAWITSNVNFQTGGSPSGANPTGDGTNARTDNSVVTAFSQVKFDDVMQKIWVSGGKPDTVYLNAFQMNVALGFTGNNNQRSNITAKDETVIKHMAVYVTPWGTVTWKPSRHIRPRDVIVVQDDMWAVGIARSTKTEELAKTGDNEKRQIVTELTLVCRNQAASGAVYDNTIV